MKNLRMFSLAIALGVAAAISSVGLAQNSRHSTDQLLSRIRLSEHRRAKTVHSVWAGPLLLRRYVTVM